MEQIKLGGGGGKRNRKKKRGTGENGEISSHIFKEDLNS